MCISDRVTPSTITLTDSTHDASFIAEVVASNAGTRDLFGSSVAVGDNGNRLVVGARLEDTAGLDTGTVYVYDWNAATSAYIEVAQLTASNAVAGDHFGSSVAISGTRLVVGANAADVVAISTGTVYVYDWNGVAYVEVAQLTASNAGAWDYFGMSVAISGTRLVVGAHLEDSAAVNTGKVYVYDWNGVAYVEVAQLRASDAQANDRFGMSVALSGTRLVVGAHLEDTAAVDAGKVYIYEWNPTTSAYIEVAQLTASDPLASAYFGGAVALSGNRLVVGAYGVDAVAINSGKVYVYDWNGTAYTEVTTITASDAQANDYFGSSVALSGDRLLVGAYFEDTAGLNAGKVYSLDLYAEITNGGRFTLLASNVTPHSELGYMVYYDKKYNDIIVIPSLELYRSMSYINNQILTISGYGVNFSGNAGDKLPTLNPLYDIKSTLANLTTSVKNQVRGVYFESMVTPTLNYSSASISPVLLINFGTPLTMFPVLNFVTDINVFGYDSLFTNSPQHLGNQKLQNTGTLVVSIPL